MDSLEKKLKAKLGEDLARFLVRNVSGVTPDNVQIVNGRLAEKVDYELVAQWLRTQLNPAKIKAEAKDQRSAVEIADSAGYRLLKCKTFADYKHLKKYYAKGEALCKFNDDRTKDYFIFWLVHKEIDNIRREDFKNPQRQDAYGTSCMSVDIARNGSGFIKICNRYNHTVQSPDDTFGSNLERIAKGWTAAMERDYGVTIRRAGAPSPHNSIIVGQTMYFYEREAGGVFYSERFQNFVRGGVIYNEPEVWVIVKPFAFNIKNPADSFMLTDHGSQLTFAQGKRIIVHADEDSAVRANEKNPDAIHIVRPKGGS